MTVTYRPSTLHVDVSPGGGLTLTSRTNRVTVTSRNSTLLVRHRVPRVTMLTGGAPGPVGPQGPQGEPGVPGAPGGQAYIHEQTTPAGTWTIIHNLGRKVHLSLFLTNGKMALTDVDQDDENTAVLTFPQPVAGTAYLS